jgi:drug/metabolite transporter (DMT)-like permease
VLGAAILHASWNALVKVEGDRLVVLGGFVATHLVVAAAGIWFFPLPTAAAWPYILAGGAVHTGYKMFLAEAYHHGDFGLVYPIARGAAPLLVALFAWLWWGETLPPTGFIAMLIMTGAIVSLSWRGNGSFKAAALALATGLMIATYTVIDGGGARILGNPHSYFLWMVLVDAVLFLSIVCVRRQNAVSRIANRWRPGLAAGVMSLAAYWLVVWGLSQSPMALVSAVRETSVVFAALIATVLLKEGNARHRILAAVAVAFGIVLLRAG